MQACWINSSQCSAHRCTSQVQHAAEGAHMAITARKDMHPGPSEESLLSEPLPFNTPTTATNTNPKLCAPLKCRTGGCDATAKYALLA
jgi:hypothetical protein